MGAIDIKRLIKRYWPSVVFPIFFAGCIYADWSHTQEWKKQVAKEKLLLENENVS